MNISPILVRCSFSLSKKEARPNWLAYLIAALAVAGLVFLLWIFIPRPSKLIWIKTEDGRVFSGKVRRGQKLWLDKHPTSEFLEVGFPHHYVTAGKKQSLIVCDDTERLKVTFGKEVTLSTTEGEKMTATFFESDPSKQEAQQGEATPGHLPGPMDKI